VTATATATSPPEATRARYPDAEGYVERDGVRVFWEGYGEGEPAICFLPTWSIVHSRLWKAQIPYFARRHTVLTFDGRGNGRSDRPLEPAAYSPDEFAADALAVLEAAGIERAVTVSVSLGTVWNLILAATRPEHVPGAVFIGPLFPVPPLPDLTHAPFHDELPPDPDGSSFNRHAWLRDWSGFVRWFAGLNLPEPHSTRQLEDYLDWALETTPEVMVATWAGAMEGHATLADAFASNEEVSALAGNVDCPSLVICGDRDTLTPPHFGLALAEATGGRLEILEGSGHLPQTRAPVSVNLLLRDFVEELEGDTL
jgi:pimeloyl-ACP methyl ester carboxylesterase